jgi:hypothetical protein
MLKGFPYKHIKNENYILILMATSKSEDIQEFCNILKYGAKDSSDGESSDINIRKHLTTTSSESEKQEERDNPLSSTYSSSESEQECEQERNNPLSVVLKDVIMGESSDYTDREYYMLLIIVRNIIKLWFTVMMIGMLVSAGRVC